MMIWQVCYVSVYLRLVLLGYVNPRDHSIKAQLHHKLIDGFGL